MFQTNSSIIGLCCWEHAKQSKCGDTRESEKTPHTKKIDNPPFTSGARHDCGGGLFVNLERLARQCIDL